MGATTRVPIRREITKDRATQKLQQNAAAATQAINALPRKGQVTIYDQRFVVGTNTIVIHGLGRQPKGYALVNIRPDPTQAAPTGTQGAQRNLTTDDSQTISLGPFQPFIADIEVW